MAFAGPGGSGELQHIGETGRIENCRGLIPNLLHQKADATGFFVGTILAFLVCGFARTG